jgi:hypothetical protein
MKAAGLPEGREIGCETGNFCVFSAEKGWGKETVIEAGAMGVRFDSMEAIERGNAENETKMWKINVTYSSFNIFLHILYKPAF